MLLVTLVHACGCLAALWQIKDCGIACDERGFALVHDTLQSVSHPEVFAVGDCATLRSAPHAKSGLYAVRHGETLTRSLRNLVDGKAPETYRPQRRALSILSCGARYAIAEWGAWTAEGRWVWWCKDRIDRRWIISLREKTDRSAFALLLRR